MKTQSTKWTCKPPKAGQTYCVGDKTYQVIEAKKEGDKWVVTRRRVK